MARVLAVFDDLLLGSNVLGMLRAAGHDATLTGGADVQPAGADLHAVGLAQRLRAGGGRQGREHQHQEGRPGPRPSRCGVRALHVQRRAAPCCARVGGAPLHCSPRHAPQS